MNLNYQQWLPADFSPESRVWVYQCNRLFSLSEALEIEDLIESFAADWRSHGDPVKGYGNLLYGQFIVLMADETATGVSGCSTDGSVRLVKQIESRFNVSLFDRLQLAFVVKDKIQLLPLAQLEYALSNQFITPDTLYFNNTVLTKKEMENNWLIPVKESWLKNKLAGSLPA